MQLQIAFILLLFLSVSIARKPRNADPPVTISEAKRMVNSLCNLLPGILREIFLNGESAHNSISRLGGKEFLETREERKARNEKCAAELPSVFLSHEYNSGAVAPGFHKRDSKLINKVHFEPPRGTLGIRGHEALVDERLDTFIGTWPDEDNMESIMSSLASSTRSAQQSLADPIAIHISKMIIQMSVMPQLASLNADVVCMHRRLIRAALVTYYSGLPEDERRVADFVFRLPVFQELIEAVTSDLHLFLAKRFSVTAEVLTSALMDSMLNADLLLDDARYIMLRFPDISEADIKIASSILSKTISNTKPLSNDVSDQAVGAERERILREAEIAVKVHYSHRAARLFDIIKAVYESVWTRRMLISGLSDNLLEYWTNSDATQMRLADEVRDYSAEAARHRSPKDDYERYLQRSFAKINSRLQSLKGRIMAYQPFASFDFDGKKQIALNRITGDSSIPIGRNNTTVGLDHDASSIPPATDAGAPDPSAAPPSADAQS